MTKDPLEVARELREGVKLTSQGMFYDIEGTEELMRTAATLIEESVATPVVKNKSLKPVCSSYHSMSLNGSCQNCGQTKASHNHRQP